jgi:NAD(P)-dependent dehydrogenase (short-subunit alcohol dehydrogenase family)
MSKIAIVTGGAKGIGYGSTKRLLDDGVTVIMFDLDEAGLVKAQEELATNLCKQCDEIHLYLQKSQCQFQNLRSYC